MSEVDAGEHVASPTPTPRRATINCAKLRARPRHGGQQTPHEHAGRQNHATGFVIRQAAERQPDHGVEQREHRSEQAERGVAERPLAPDSFADAADDLAVEEVHQVDRKEHDECVAQRLAPRELQASLKTDASPPESPRPQSGAEPKSCRPDRAVRGRALSCRRRRRHPRRRAPRRPAGRRRRSCRPRRSCRRGRRRPRAPRDRRRARPFSPHVRCRCQSRTPRSRCRRSAPGLPAPP